MYSQIVKPETFVQKAALDELKIVDSIDVIRIEPGFGATFGLPDSLIYLPNGRRIHAEFKCRPKSAVDFGTKVKTAHDKLRSSQLRAFPIMAKRGETILVIEGLIHSRECISYEVLSFNDPTVRMHFASAKLLASWIIKEFGWNPVDSA